MSTQNSEPITEGLLGPQASGLKSNQIIICRQTGCHDISTTQGYCRIHYLFSWKKLKTKEAKKKGQELEAYLEEVGRKFPEEFLEKLRADVDEMIEKAKAEDSDDEPAIEALDGDEDLDTIIKGLRVEDY